MTDLFHDGRQVGAWHGVAHRHVLDGGCQVDVPSSDAHGKALLGLLKAAEDRKRRAATAMNERSSRAHSLLILRLIQHDGSDASEDVESTICFADLGGSEQVRGPREATAAQRRGGGECAAWRAQGSYGTAAPPQILWRVYVFLCAQERGMHQDAQVLC